MATFSKQRGLFGAPMAGQTPGFVPDGVSSSPAAAMLAPSTETFTPAKRTFLDKVGLLADAFQGTNTNAMQLQAQDERDFARWNATAGAQQRAAAEFGQFVAREQYKAAHPGTQEDDAFTRSLRAAGIDPTSSQGQALYRQRVQTLASPAPNFVSDGAGGGRWVTPPAPSMVPQAPVGRLMPMGGAPSQGARTFPVR